MLGKSSVLMMLLVGTGSLVGISSIYTPANVETQPQPQPQKPQTTIPGLKMPQSKIELGQQIADQNALRAIQDKQLLDRLMPQIIKRIDVKLVLTERPSKTVIVDHEGLGRDPITTKATCAPGETAVAAEYLSSVGDVWSIQRGEYGNPSEWSILAWADSNGGVRVTAMCLTAELSLKGAQQPQPQTQPQPQQPTQPPGGPPLQPPPGLVK